MTPLLKLNEMGSIIKNEMLTRLFKKGRVKLDELREG
jgi:hypothetical protein